MTDQLPSVCRIEGAAGECGVVSGGNDRLNLNEPVLANEAIGAVTVSLVIKEPAVIHVDEVHLFVEHAGNGLLFVPAFHVFV